MSNELHQKLDAILAAIGFNDGANRGFWRIQPRDDEGRWIEMGGGVLFRFRTGDGNLVVATARGVYVGPTGRPGRARVLVQPDNESGLEPGVYDLDSRNLTQFKAILPGEALEGLVKSGRNDIFGRPVKSLEDSQLPTREDLESTRTEPTADDERLARGELTPEEKEAEQDGRKNSPVANLPVGFEAENPDEVKNMLRESGIDPDEFESKAKPATTEEADNKEEVARTPVSEAYAEAWYNGDTDVTVDDLLEKEAATPTNLVNRAASSLQPGEVFLNGQGDEVTVVDVKNAPNSQVVITGQLSDGRTGQFPPMHFQKELRVVKGKKNKLKPIPKPATKAEEKPKAPVAETPETPETPEAPEAEIAPEDVVPVTENFGPINFPPADRLTKEVGDGRSVEDISYSKLSDEDNRRFRNRILEPLLDSDGVPREFVDDEGQVYQAEDPFEMMNLLAQAHPSAKFTKDGSLILHRQADKDGKIFELRVNNTGKKALAFSIRFTDPSTGKYEEFFYKNDHHSTSSLFGKYGANHILDKLLGDEVLKFGRGTGDNIAGPDATIRQRAKVAFMSGPINDMRHKMVSIDENVRRLAEGRNAVYHENGTIHQSELPNLWDAFIDWYESGDSNETRDQALKDDLYHIMFSIYGRIPLTTADHEAARKALRTAFKEKFSSASNAMAKSMSGLISAASEKTRGIYRDPEPQVRAIRYASKDRTRAIEPDMVVEYTNNVGETSIVRVSKLVKNTNAVGNQEGIAYNFGDYVIIKDKNGVQRKLNALKLRILPNQQTALTKYTPNLFGQALRDRRAELGEYGVPGKALPERVPGELTTFISDTPPDPMLVEDFSVGDILPNRSGAPIGEILSIRPVKSRNGDDGLAFIVRKPDGETSEIAYRLGTELELKKA